MPSNARSNGREVNAFQALALLLAFVLVAGVGGVLAAGLVVPAVAGTKSVTSTVATVFDDLPTELKEEPLPQRSVIFDKSNHVIATFFDENRVVVPLEAVAPIMQKAVIATEDKRFYSHGAIDPTGMLRAGIKTATGDLQGASTLTQQYVKNVQIEAAVRRDDDAAVRAARTAEGAEGLNRKLREAKIAIALEQKYTKQEILERYLNIAPFGASVYGIEAAAQYFFNVPASELTALQAATLAGVTRSPTAWDPERHPVASQERRNVVLRLMLDQKLISQRAYDKYKATPLKSTLKIQKTKLGCSTAGRSAFFCDYVTKIIANDPTFGKTKKARKNLLYRGGLEIHTTLDPRLQKIADKDVRKSVPIKGEDGVAQALVSVQPGTGKIVAMAQNRDYNPGEKVKKWETAVNYNTDFAYGSSGGFQPGSTFKPFTLVAWLQAGNGLNQIIDARRRDFTPDSWTASCLDGPPTNDNYKPANAEGGEEYPIPVLKATYDSVNSAYVAMANQLDLCDIFDTAKKFGVHTTKGEDIPVRPANVLGSTEVAPLTMAAAYATFAAEGEFCEPIAITKVVNAQGKDLPVPDAKCRQVITPEVANAVTYALQRVLTIGSADNLQGLPGGRESAGKTGTTNDNAATWFVGYTPQLATAVWTGYAEGNIPLQGVTIAGHTWPHVYGASVSGPSWLRFMSQAHEGAKFETFPSIDPELLTGPQATVPGVVGMSESDARSALGRAGFSVGRSVSEEYSDSVREGAISKQSISGGARVAKGTTIWLTRSKGKAPDKCAGWTPNDGTPPPKGCDPTIQWGDNWNKDGGGGKKPGKPGALVPFARES